MEKLTSVCFDNRPDAFGPTPPGFKVESSQRETSKSNNLDATFVGYEVRRVSCATSTQDVSPPQVLPSVYPFNQQ